MPSLFLWLLACHPAGECLPACENGRACVDGACVRESWSMTVDDGHILGGMVDSELGAVEFGAEYAGRAWVEVVDGARVDVTLADADHVTVAGDRGSLDGDGELTDAERRALVALDDAGLTEAAGIAAMFLACLDEDVPPVSVAALLAPFQASLKYLEPDRVDAALAVAARSPCAWLADPWRPMDQEAPGDLVRFGPENRVPNVYGYFPFDGVGAVESGLPGAAGDAPGLCDPLCRGACGADCDPDDCTPTPIFECEEQGGESTTIVFGGVSQSCGTAEGCRAHDDCVDTCNQVEGCGTWAAARCRRACDLEDVATWGAETSGLWATGHGPKDPAPLLFRYLDPVGEEDSLTCPTGVVLPFHVVVDPPYPLLTPALGASGPTATSAPVLDGVVIAPEGATVDAYLDSDQAPLPVLRVDIATGQRERVAVRGTFTGPVVTPADWIWADADGETRYTIDRCELRVQYTVDGVVTDFPSLAEGGAFDFGASPDAGGSAVSWAIQPMCSGSSVRTVFGAPGSPVTTAVEIPGVGARFALSW